MALVTRIRGKAPTIQKILSGSGSYVPAPDVKWIRVTAVGGGGGGGGSGSTPGAVATAGTATTFGSISAGGGGVGANFDIPGIGGTASLGAEAGLAINGNDGQAGTAEDEGGLRGLGGFGGNTPFFNGGASRAIYNNVGLVAGTSNSGGGGQGGANNAVGNIISGGGGGSGAFVQAIIRTLASSYAYSVGTAGNGGGAGTGGLVGSAGAAGILIIEEFYS